MKKWFVFVVKEMNGDKLIDVGVAVSVEHG